MGDKEKNPSNALQKSQTETYQAEDKMSGLCFPKRITGLKKSLKNFSPLLILVFSWKSGLVDSQLFRYVLNIMDIVYIKVTVGKW